jgi:hypothetical protein
MRKGYGMKYFLALAFSSVLFGAIDGTVINRTTGLPAAGIPITLVKPGQGGMRTLGTTVSDASGKFAFAKDEPGGGPQLLQAAFKGVNYNKLLTPVSPTSNVELEIYDATTQPSVAQIATRFIVFEPNASQIAVGETIILKNESKTTYNNPKVGSYRFYLPRAANGQVRINAQGPQGMPLPRAAEKTEQDDVFKIDFPVKPGETQFEINYVLPAGTPFTYRSRIVPPKGMPLDTPIRLIAPSGVTLASKDIQNTGTEPKTQATIYTVTANDNFSVDITGQGTLHTPGDDAAPADTSDTPPITEGQPQIYHYLPWMAGFALSILALGLVMLYRTSPVRSPYGRSN